jgi:GntR family transcriptional repressor for pyruvate dehydrogenase complex
VSERAAGPGARGLPIVYGLVTWVTRGGLTEVLPRRSAKTSEVVAADVVRDVVARGLVIGNHLPSEAVMLEQYGVGRESLREALRLLETQGLLTIKRGPGGGPIVSGVDPTYLARNAALYFHLSGATYEEVMHAWQVLEPAVAAQVARLPDRAEVRRLMAPHLHQLHPDVERELFVSTTTGFHTTLAQLTSTRLPLSCGRSATSSWSRCWCRWTRSTSGTASSSTTSASRRRSRTGARRRRRS